MSLTSNAFDVLDQIESDNSMNVKKQLMSENADNNILYNLFYWTYNPFLHYYMNKVELPEACGKSRPNNYARHMVEFKRILGRLNSRFVTGNNARDMVWNFLKSCDNVEQKWYARVLTRDLRCGVSVTTINNVYGSVIPTFPVALAENPYIRVYPKNFRIDEKFDGYRCLTEVSDLSVSMFSRNGNDLSGYDEIEDVLGKCYPMIKDSKFFLDGELMSANFKGTQNSAFRKSSGKKANYYVFDIISRGSFYNVDGYCALVDREQILDIYITQMREKAERLGIDSSCIVMVEPLLRCYNCFITLRQDFANAYGYKEKYMAKAYTQKFISELCDNAYAYALDCGLEGVIVKDLDSLYMEGKSYSSECAKVKRKDQKWYSWAKRKPVDTLDLVVQDIYEGTGENKGRLGGVNVIYKASDGKNYTVGVGSGFKKEERIKYWDNPNSIIGKTIEVHYDIETQDANGNYSLRFPRFKKVRLDK